MSDPAQRLLAELDMIVAAHPGISAHGVAVLEGNAVIAFAGFCGTTLAAPDSIVRLVNCAPSPPALLLTNDPHAGGAGLDCVFLMGRSGARSVVAALTFRDFGAMRKDVFRHRAETFHEGLALSLLSVDWSGSDRDVVLSVIDANVKDGGVARAVMDQAARATLAACHLSDAIEPSPVKLPAISGQASSRAIVANSNDATVDVTFEANDGGWRLRTSLDSRNPTEVARCSASSIRSASMLGIADALSLPATALLRTLDVEGTGVAAVAPEAVGDGTPLAYACYRAAFDAARNLIGGSSAPRDEVAFLVRQ
jgi:hypothetical protein